MKHKNRLTREIYDDDSRVNYFSLTPTSLSALEKLADKLNINESFAAEAIIRHGLDDARKFYKQNKFKPERKRFKSLSRYGEKKVNKGICLTDKSVYLLDVVGEELNDSASEVLEWAIRAGLSKVERYIVNILKDNN